MPPEEVLLAFKTKLHLMPALCNLTNVESMRFASTSQRVAGIIPIGNSTDGLLLVARRGHYYELVEEWEKKVVLLIPEILKKRMRMGFQPHISEGQLFHEHFGVSPYTLDLTPEEDGFRVGAYAA